MQRHHRRYSLLSLRSEEQASGPAQDPLPHVAARRSLCIYNGLRSTPRRISPQIHALTPPPWLAFCMRACQGNPEPDEARATTPGFALSTRLYLGGLGRPLWHSHSWLYSRASSKHTSTGNSACATFQLLRVNSVWQLPRNRLAGDKVAETPALRAAAPGPDPAAPIRNP